MIFSHQVSGRGSNIASDRLAELLLANRSGTRSGRGNSSASVVDSRELSHAAAAIDIDQHDPWELERDDDHMQVATAVSSSTDRSVEVVVAVPVDESNKNGATKLREINGGEYVNAHDHEGQDFGAGADSDVDATLPAPAPLSCYETYNYMSCGLSLFSMLCCNGFVSYIVVNGIFSILACNAVASLLCINSVASILSINSICSIGCVNGRFQICFGTVPAETSYSDSSSSDTVPISGWNHG
jgi:hypothetical protein